MADKTFENYVEERAAVTIADADEFVVRDDSAVDVKKITSSNLKTAMGLQHNGSAAAPSYSFSSDPDTGMYRQGANEVGFTTDGTENLRLTGSNLRMASETSAIYNTGYFRGVAATGTASSPTYSWDGDTDTGMYSDASNSISLATGGVQRLDVDGGGIKGKVAFQALLGSEAAPGFAFDGDTDTGMYRRGTNDIGFATGGAERVSIRSNGYMYAGWINTESGSNTATPSRIYTNSGGSDSFLRYMTLENFRESVADYTVFCDPQTRTLNTTANRTAGAIYNYQFATTVGGVAVSGAKAVIMNVHTRTTASGYLTIWNYADSTPTTSTINTNGTDVASSCVTVGIDSSRRVKYEYNAATGNITYFDVIGFIF